MVAFMKLWDIEPMMMDKNGIPRPVTMATADPIKMSMKSNLSA